MKGFQSPKNPVKPRSSSPVPCIGTINSFQLLNPTASATNTAFGQTSPHEKQAKPPAIYIYGISNKYNFVRTLSVTCSRTRRIRHGKDLICFHVDIQDNFDKIKAYCLQTKLQFTTDVPKKRTVHIRWPYVRCPWILPVKIFNKTCWIDTFQSLQSSKCMNLTK